MRDLLKPQNINLMSGLLFLISSFNLNIKETLAQEVDIPTLEQVFEETNSIECIVNQNVYQVLEGANFTIGLSGISGIFHDGIKNINSENIVFDTENWSEFDLNFDFFSTDINYKNGLANLDLDFYIFFSDRTQIYLRSNIDSNFESFLDSNHENIADLNLIFTEITYFPLLNELWIFSIDPDYLIRINITQDNYQHLEVGPILNTVQLFNSVSRATQILDHTFLTQYVNGSCGSISITTDGIFELANILPNHLRHLCNEDTDLIVNEREIGVFYFKKQDGNIDQIICNNGIPKPQITPEVDPEPDMELDMEIPLDMTVDMEVPLDMGLDMNVDMEVPLDMELDMNLPLDMTADMEVQIDPDMQIDMELPLDMNVDMEVPLDMELDIELPLDMNVDMEVQIDPDMQIDMEASRDMELDMEIPLDMNVDMEAEDDFDKDKDKDQEGSNTKRKSKSSGCSVESNDSQNVTLLFLMGLLSLKRLRRSKDSEI